MAISFGGQEAVLTGSTAVDLVDAPAASTSRVVGSCIVHNNDTASRTITIKKVKGGSDWVLTSQSVNSGDTLLFEPRGGVILDATDEKITVEADASAATTEPDATASYADHT